MGITSAEYAAAMSRVSVVETLLAIDPGNEQSAYVVYDGMKLRMKGIAPNDEIIQILGTEPAVADILVIEQVACMGMAVGAEVFETVFWSGRFAGQWDMLDREWDRMKRHEIKMHLCGSMRAKDANIRQALIDKFGGVNAVGKKHSPGPLYKVSKDIWAALALAVTYWDKKIVSPLVPSDASRAGRKEE